ncbi:MAG TPA: hypothetical protein VFV78_13415 [Vicinamibacterales bacterium]|nr:hypothetical protein [Vicinamibacterales bacterium]
MDVQLDRAKRRHGQYQLRSRPDGSRGGALARPAGDDHDRVARIRGRRGYGKYIFSSLPGGYEFRGLVGRRWEESETLSPARTYVGGEATLMFVWFRFSGGLVVPIDAGRPHQPVLTGSIGWMIPLTPLWNKELRTMK